jgi:2-phosphoglycerate kinase
MIDQPKLILIGGASHTGKSTLARSLADHFNWNYCSTDKLARHPGRPWQTQFTDIPQHVVDHYQLLSATELVEDVLNHYRQNVWPQIEQIVNNAATDIAEKGTIIEGSALLPELVNTLKFANIATVWLTASNEFLRHRIYLSSQYASKSQFEQMLIDKFWERNCLYNDRLIDTVDRLGFVSLNVSAVATPSELMCQYLALVVNKKW